MSLILLAGPGGIGRAKRRWAGAVWHSAWWALAWRSRVEVERLDLVILWTCDDFVKNVWYWGDFCCYFVNPWLWFVW
jgi:hypothetical protein